MFAESILETTWNQRTRRGWTTLTSFGVQAVLLTALITIPLLRTIGIPLARTVSTPITMGHRSADPGPAPGAHHFHSAAVEIVPYTGRIMAPTSIPHGISKGEDAANAGADDGFSTGTDFSTPYNPGANLPIPMSGNHPVMPVPAAPSKPTFRTSTMLQGSLIRRVEPVYPPLARAARIQGPVVVEAIIGKDGTMERLQLISGHPMLAPAAIEAVRQWRYRPYILNGDAIEVETQITVNFVLAN